MRHSSKKGHSSKAGSALKLLTGFAVLGFAAGLLLRKGTQKEASGSQAIDKEFSDIARGKNSQVPGVDPLPPQEPM